MVKDNALHYCLIIFKKSALLQNFSSHRDKLQQKSDLSLFTPLGDATFPSQESDLRNKWNQHTSENLSIKLSAQLMVIGNNNSMKTWKKSPSRACRAAGDKPSPCQMNRAFVCWCGQQKKPPDGCKLIIIPTGCPEWTFKGSPSLFCWFSEVVVRQSTWCLPGASTSFAVQNNQFVYKSAYKESFRPNLLSEFFQLASLASSRFAFIN